MAPLLGALLLSGRHIVGGTAAQREEMRATRFRDGAVLLGVPGALLAGLGCAFFYASNRKTLMVLRSGRRSPARVDGLLPLDEELVTLRLGIDSYSEARVGIPKAAGIQIGQTLELYRSEQAPTLGAIVLPSGDAYHAFMGPPLPLSTVQQRGRGSALADEPT